jgi:dipeptidyl aminopeptidase/acylaminoacyl peptidase
LRIGRKVLRLFVKRVLTFGVTACLLTTLLTAEEMRTFSIQDSIELSYIIDSDASTAVEIRGAYPPGDVEESPDRAKFLVVTQRGVLATNSLEATIWVFERKSITDYVLSRSSKRPVPTRIVTFSAQSNTPVIADVRWLPDSQRISFLGKNRSPFQQLFLADLDTGTVTQLTKDKDYVSAYNISGSTIAYTTIVIAAPYSMSADAQIDPISGDEIVDVAGKNLFYLLYPKRNNIDDLDEAELLFYPNTLHVVQNGRESQLQFAIGGKPLRLGLPVLSLSPDGQWLITVAFTTKLPPDWANYQTEAEVQAKFNLSAEHQRELDEFDAHRASQFVLVNLRNGTIAPLINAPVGRSLYWFFAPTAAIWSPDGQKIVLSNTFMPGDEAPDQAERERRYHSPAIVEVYIATRKLRRIVSLERPPVAAKEEDIRITGIQWDQAREEIRLTYGGRKDAVQGPRVLTYHLGDRDASADPPLGKSQADADLEFSVEQDLNHSPVLTASGGKHEHASVIWDPNPQLSRVNLGTVKRYEWKDDKGERWSGLLALPPDYDPLRRYPLLIQTYGYEAHQFFTDGQFTSSYAGRAASANGIVVLQMARDSSHVMTSEDGPANLRGFESAIDELSTAGLVDRSRVGVIGFSYTCFYVLYTLTHHPDLFAAASIFDGTSMSYVQNVLSTSLGNGLQDLSNAENGGPPFGAALKSWLERAPGFNLDKVVTPLRMYEFERTALLYDWEVYSGLFRLKKPVDIVWLRKENAPHILVKPHQRYLAQQGAVDWFLFWLLGKEDPDTTKARQYARWRELRSLVEAQKHH